MLTLIMEEIKSAKYIFITIIVQIYKYGSS